MPQNKNKSGFNLFYFYFFCLSQFSTAKRNKSGLIIPCISYRLLGVRFLPACAGCRWYLIQHEQSELLLGIFKQGPTPPLCSEKGATVFCHRAIQWFHRNCSIFFIWKINQIKTNFDKRMTIMTDCFKMTFV